MALAPSRYELLDRIAVGGMAEVFRAKAFGAHGFEKTLAIKKILPKLANDPEFEERFIAEAKLAVGLSHANVVQVLDFGRFAGTLFIAMELVQGLDLAALLKFYVDEDELVPLPAAFQIAMELTRGLAFAHEHAVVHRDVSPSNILLSKAGEVKIADFGIALAMEELPGEEGRIMGKWRYMSPEQTRGGKLTPRSDVFSAAVVIYELFSGRKLFPGDSSKQIIEHIHQMEIPPLSQVRPGVPKAVDVLLARAFARDADERDVSCADLVRALTEASYKSSVVSTSMDVADSVARALEGGPDVSSLAPHEGDNARGNMDELIRAQLKAEKRFQPVDRKTAVASDPALANTAVGSEEAGLEARGDSGTMVRTGVDGRGVTVWELKKTVAAVPSAKRRSGMHPSLDDDDSADSGVDQHNSEKIDDNSAVAIAARSSRYQADEPSEALRKGVIYSGIGFSALAAILLFFAFNGPSRNAASQPGDAAVTVAPTATTATLILESNPTGATVFFDGEQQKKTTPLTITAASGIHEVELFVDGYERIVEEVDLPAGETYRLSPRLIPFVATLVVTTAPKGATIYLDGEEIGESPLTQSQLRPGKSRKLEIRLKDHKTVSKEIDLVANESVFVDEALRSSVSIGSVRIDVRGSWAFVIVGNKSLGETPGPFRLPVGTHRVLLHNTTTGKKKHVTVEVVEDRVKAYRFDL